MQMYILNLILLNEQFLKIDIGIYIYIARSQFRGKYFDGFLFKLLYINVGLNKNKS